MKWSILLENWFRQASNPKNPRTTKNIQKCRCNQSIFHIFWGSIQLCMSFPYYSNNSSIEVSMGEVGTAVLLVPVYVRNRRENPGFVVTPIFLEVSAYSGLNTNNKTNIAIFGDSSRGHVARSNIEIWAWRVFVSKRPYYLLRPKKPTRLDLTPRFRSVFQTKELNVWFRACLGFF